MGEGQAREQWLHRGSTKPATSRTLRATCGDVGLQAGVVVVRTVTLMIVRRMLNVLSCGRRPDAVEIAVLRNQLAVLRRQVPRPRNTPADRMLLATLAKLLPHERWPTFLVTPSTLLRWHRELVAHRWTYRFRLGHLRYVDVSDETMPDPTFTAQLSSLTRSATAWQRSDGLRVPP